MKRRFLSFILVLALFVSAFSGLVSAEADYFESFREARKNGTYQENPNARKEAEEIFQNSDLAKLAQAYFSTHNLGDNSEKNTKSLAPDFSSFDWHETKDSTCFSYVGYDEDQEELAVIFRSNDTRIYVYDDFTAADFDDFFSASSLGKYYNKYIKGSYDCTRYDDTGTAIFK